MRLWQSSDSVKKLKINSRNRRSGREVAFGTHTGGSITIGEHRKRLAVEKGRDPTPSELQLHVHTHGHDEKSFVDERARIVHESTKKYCEKKIESQSDVDQIEVYYQAAGGEKKRRIYGLGSQAKNYYGLSLHISSRSDASSSSSPSVSQSATTKNLDELVMRLIPSLSNHLLPILVERIRGVFSSPADQRSIPIGDPSSRGPIVLPFTNIDANDDSSSPGH